MRVSELNGQGSAVWLALSTFSVVRVLRGLGGFLFVSLPVVLNDVTHRRMVLGEGMSP
jgi:hypothetical protein